MPVALPLIPSVPNYRVSTALENTQYIFDVRWNSRDLSWYLDISTETDEPIRVGMRIMLGTILGARSTDPRMPPGMLIAADLTNTGIDAGFDDLGTRIAVLYYTLDEAAAA